MMRLPARYLAICFAALTAQGCITIGGEFPSQVTWIVTNKSTRREIETRFGEPFRVGYDTGFLTYTYGFYRYSVFVPARTKDLTVRFNPDGTVNSYSFASSFEDDKNAISKK